MSLGGAWLLSQALTQAVELPVAGVFLRHTGAGWPRRLAVAALGSAITHPALWFLWPRVVPDYRAGVLSGELLTLVVEAALYTVLVPAAPREALRASAFANAASYLVGALLLTGAR